MLVFKNISKIFPGVKALDNVNLKVKKGEIHGLIGENGAGKSTLMKILSGAYTRDTGEIYLEGEPEEIGSPKRAEELGISIIYQEFNLVPSLSVAENIFLGKLPKKNKLVDWGVIKGLAEKALVEVGITIDPDTAIEELSVAEQQMVEIAKAISLDCKILVMDEPTSALTGEETQKLFKVMKRLKKQGIAIIFISHRLEEMFEITDRISVLRDGQYIGTEDKGGITEDKLISMMVGRSLSQKFPAKEYQAGKKIFSVEGLTNEKIKDVSFSLKEGEILGIAGLVGSGRTETVRAIFGADQLESGKIYINDKEIKITSPKSAIKAGIGLVPEDRKSQGLVLKLSVKENILMAALKKALKGFFLSPEKEAMIGRKYVKDLKIKTPGTDSLVNNLSGGNQQKVVLSKWLNCDPDIIIMDEPTRGIDVNSKMEIYNIIVELVKRGKGIIIVSSELPEILGISDRIIVMHEGEVKGELKSQDATQEKIMHYATGGE